MAGPTRCRRAERLPVGLAIAAGVALRGYSLLRSRSVRLGHPDAVTYVIAARGSLFWNPYRPAGYPLILRALHRTAPRLEAVLVAQHAMGVATALLLQVTARRHLRRRALAIAPAATVLLSGTQLELERSVMSETAYTLTLALALACAERSGAARRCRVWRAAAGAAIGASGTLRSPGILATIPVAAWSASRPGLRPPERVGAATAVLGGAAAVLGPYLAAVHRATGSWSLTRTTRFTLYARVAPLADCARFEPPAGTEALCETTPVSTRPNATAYMFDWQNSPALRLYGVPPYPLESAPHAAYGWEGERPLGRFAAAVLRHQPLDYLRSVAEAAANFARPGAGAPSSLGWTHRRLIAELRNARFEEAADDEVRAYYGGVARWETARPDRLDGFAGRARVEGIPTAALAALALAGWAAAGRGPRRRAIALVGGTTLFMALATSGLLFYDVRYATPLYGPLAAAAAVGADALLDRRPETKRRSGTAAGRRAR